MTRLPRIVEDPVPPRLLKIVESRMEVFVSHFLRRAYFDGLNVKQLAASAYLQGFCDCYDAQTHKSEEETHTNG